MEQRSVKIKKTISSMVSHDFESAYISISLGTKNYVSEDFVRALHFLENRFERRAIYIGDHFYRNTVKITHDSNTRNSQREAIKLGKDFVKQHRAKFKGFEVIFSSNLAKGRQYEKHLKTVNELAKGNSTLLNLIVSDAMTFVARMHKKQLVAIDSQTACMLSIQYILEEIAMYRVLIDNSWYVEYYPGPELSSIAFLINNSDEIPLLKQKVSIQYK